MYMLKPYEKGKNIFHNKMVAKMHAEHEERIHNMKSHIREKGLNKPRPVPKSFLANPKRRMLEDERFERIEKANARLLESMTKIMEGRDHPPISHWRKYPNIISKNLSGRKQMAEKINTSNKVILDRIRATGPYYKHKEWEQDRRKNEHILQGMCLYPYQLSVYREGGGRRRQAADAPREDAFDAEWFRSISSLSEPQYGMAQERSFSQAAIGRGGSEDLLLPRVQGSGRISSPVYTSAVGGIDGNARETFVPEAWELGPAAGASAAHIAASGAVAKAKLPPLEASAHAASSDVLAEMDADAAEAQAAAAVKIQSLNRGRQDRRRVQQLREERASAAAAGVSSDVAGSDGMSQDEAVLKIQNMQRARAARQRTDRMKRDKESAAIKDLRHRLHERLVSDGQLFSMMDANRDGNLTISEVGRGLHMAGIYFTGEELQDLFEEFDKDGSGSVNWDELRKAIHQSPKKKHRTGFKTVAGYGKLPPDMAATRIQRIQRGKKDRKRVQELKAQRAAAAAGYDNLALSEADIAAREAAAVRIQARARGFNNRRKPAADHAAAARERRAQYEVEKKAKQNRQFGSDDVGAASNTEAVEADTSQSTAAESHSGPTELDVSRAESDTVATESETSSNLHAAESEAPATELEAATSELEAPSSEAEAPVAKPEAAAEQPESTAAEPEDASAQPEAAESEGASAESEAAATESEAAAAVPESTEPEASAVESEPAAGEPEAASTKPDAAATESEAALTTDSAEPEAAATEAEAPVGEPENALAEPEAAASEAEAAAGEPENASAEPEASASEAEAAVAEPESTEPEAAASEAEAAAGEPENASAEPEAAAAESAATVAEPESTEPEASASEAEAAAGEPENASVGPESETAATGSEVTAAEPEPSAIQHETDAVEPEAELTEGVPAQTENAVADVKAEDEHDGSGEAAAE